MPKIYSVTHAKNKYDICTKLLCVACLFQFMVFTCTAIEYNSIQ